MKNENLILLLIGSLAGIAGYEVYETYGLIMASAVLLITGWILFNFRNGDTVVDSAKTFFNPFHFAITAFLIGFSYLALRGDPVESIFLWGIGISLSAIIISMLGFKYWTIGAE